ncbi:IS110 family transposase [Antrihabitans cavernicola]|uniref:IS110 family transposase n=1 Tax=Antrihabitans cavernicola TaxID=2495913 RepID=UPI001F20A69C|nr:IS110 family transposase [Spelaeibacter cavernicola]
MTATTVQPQPAVVVGVDAHKDTHHGVILTTTGQRLADRQFEATSAGYRQLRDWVREFGAEAVFAVESTGSYGAGLTRYLLDAGHEVREVNTPHAHAKARRGKTDALDAEAAARKVLAGDAIASPKTSSGAVESIRMLTVARNSAVKARSVALVQLQSVLVTAPASLREQITVTGIRRQAAVCGKFRPDIARLSDPVQAAKLTLKTLAQRITELDTEIAALDSHLETLVADVAPTLVSRTGIGAGHAAQFLITAGQNVQRLHSEAAFARLCGAAPIPVSSGRTDRMRLHRGGDRQANRALHMVVVVRLRFDQRTIDYMRRRRAEGLSKKDVMRCLKRFIAREVYHDLRTDLAPLIEPLNAISRAIPDTTVESCGTLLCGGSKC